jgi:4-aminobutyrate aminotransferase-like enzyme
VVRLLPPLILSREQAQLLLDRLIPLIEARLGRA